MDELRRRLESEIDRRVTDLSASVQHYVQTAVKLAVHPLEQQLSLLVSRVESDRQGREEYRLKRERDEAEVAKERAETHALIVSAQLAPGEARNRYRTALLATLGTIVVALIALASAAIASHR